MTDSTPAPPTAYNHYVSMNGAPYVFTTAKSADDAARLAAISFAEQRAKAAATATAPAPSHAMWIKFEQKECEAVDRYVDESRVVVEWDETPRVATVSFVDRVRDGTFRAGYTTVTKLATFGVHVVPRFISPLKVAQFFTDRAAAAAAAAVAKAENDKWAAETAAAAKAAAEAAAAAAAKTPSTGLPVVPTTAPTAPVAVAAVAVVPTPPTLPPTPPAPAFDDAFKSFTQ